MQDRIEQLEERADRIDAEIAALRKLVDELMNADAGQGHRASA